MPFDQSLGDLAGQQPNPSQPSLPPPQGLPPAQPTPDWYSRMTQYQQQRGGLGSGLSDIAAQTGNAAWDAYKKTVDPIWTAMTTPPGMTPQDLGQQARTAADLGYNLTTGGMGLGTKFGEKAGLGIMGGTFGRWGNQAFEDLGLAKQMEAQGMNRTQIRAASQWFKENSTGIWNKEIYDHPSTLNEFKMPLTNNYQNQTITMGEFLNHPDLYNVYPFLKDMPVTFVNSPAQFAAKRSGIYSFPEPGFPNGHITIYNPHRIATSEIKLTTLHELQHAVDVYEGRKFTDQTGLPKEAYFKLIEEARARNTEYRSMFTPEELKQDSMNPWWTMRQMEAPVSEMATTLPPP